MATALQLFRAQCASRSVTVRFMGTFKDVPQGPPDAILGLTEAFKKDTFTDKVSLGAGAYRDDNGQPHVLSCVRKAEEMIAQEDRNKEYDPISGAAEFISSAQSLLFGSSASSLKLASTQTISGTGALRIGAEFLKRFYPFPQDSTAPSVYFPNPTWGNHIPIFRDAGITGEMYKYYDASNCGLDFKGMTDNLKALDEGSVVVLHACAHNPTGVDPTPAQWEEISGILKEHKLFPFVDCAYQGFATGDVEGDVVALHKLIQDGHKPVVCQSFAKNMGLYGERVGALHVVCETDDEAAAVLSQLKILVRPMYSSPPINGARIATKILTTPELYKLWLVEVKEMADRIISMRSALREALAAQGSNKDWSHVTNQIGMFCYTGLSKEQVERMVKDFHVYMTGDGRISICGLTTGNVEYVAKAMHEVTK